MTFLDVINKSFKYQRLFKLIKSDWKWNGKIQRQNFDFTAAVKPRDFLKTCHMIWNKEEV